MVSVQQVKEKAENYIDFKTVFSVIAAGGVLAGTIWGLRKVGLKKAASVVSKAK